MEYVSLIFIQHFLSWKNKNNLTIKVFWFNMAKVQKVYFPTHSVFTQFSPVLFEV